MYSGNTLLEAFFKATFLYLGWQSSQHVCSVFRQLPSMKICYMWCFVTGTFGTAMLLCASLGISSKQQVLQSTIKKPAVFKRSNLVRKTSKQITLLGIELNGPGAVSALKSLSSLGWERECSPVWQWPNQTGWYLAASLQFSTGFLCISLMCEYMQPDAHCTHHSLPPRSSLQAGHAETLRSSLSIHTGTSASWMPN